MGTLRIKRGTKTQLQTSPGYTPAEGELVYTTDSKEVFVGDGATVGGVPVSVSTQNLEDLGNVQALAAQKDQILVYNGSNWAATDNPALDLRGNIYADDSTLLVDAINGRIVGPIETTSIISSGAIVGDVVGDVVGSVTGNVVGDTTGTHFGDVIGELRGDVKGSVFADDSTVLVDAVSGIITASVTGDINTNNVIRVNGVAGALIPAGGNILQADGFMDPGSGRNSGVGMNIRAARTDGNGNPVVVEPGDALLDIVASGWDGNSWKSAMAIKFAVDKNVTVSDEIIPGRIIFAAYDNTGNFGVNSIMVFTSEGKLSVGAGDAPQEKLHVNGNALISGSVTGTDVVATSTFQFPGLTTAERDALTPVNGMMIYNTSINKFQGYENGGWVNLV